MAEVWLLGQIYPEGMSICSFITILSWNKATSLRGQIAMAKVRSKFVDYSPEGMFEKNICIYVWYNFRQDSTGTNEGVLSVNFSPDGTQFVSSSQNGMIRVGVFSDRIITTKGSEYRYIVCA